MCVFYKASGYPGYDNRGVNSPAQVARRLDERYVQTYGHASFTPAAVQEAVHVHLLQKQSIVQEKVATPPEAPKDIAKWDMTLRPHHIVAERSVRSQANIHENYKSVFSAFGDLNIQTGVQMTDQHKPWYLGMAFPFTLPRVVGGYDIQNQACWRRPGHEDFPRPRALLHDWMIPVRGSAPN